MVEISFKHQHEESELAGKTVSEARRHYRDEFGIPDKAVARLNGSTVKAAAEKDAVLADDDRLTFSSSRGLGVYLVGAALLALAVTGGVFAFGFVNATTSLNVTSVDSNFADVTANITGSTNVTWNAYGFYKGSIGGPSIIYSVAPAASYTGDLVTTVTIGNAGDLIKRYRVLALQLEMVDLSGNVLDINESGVADADDWVMLTLDNGSASLFTTNGAGGMYLRVRGGFYSTNVRPFTGWTGSATPQLFSEVAQR